MTAQIPDRLEVDHPGLTIGTWSLVAVIRGEPSEQNYGLGDGPVFTVDIGQTATKPERSVEIVRRAPGGSMAVEQVRYRHAPQPNEYGNVRFKPSVATSANWRGYVKVYRLTGAGQLVIERVEYSALCSPCPPDIVNQTIEGNFYMILTSRHAWPSASVYIPFRDGVIVLERSKWLCGYGLAFEQGCHPDFPRRPRLPLEEGGVVGKKSRRSLERPRRITRDDDSDDDGDERE